MSPPDSNWRTRNGTRSEQIEVTFRLPSIATGESVGHDFENREPILN